MKRYSLIASVLFCALLLAAPVAVRAAAVTPTTTQTVVLEKGWNAVFLELQPVDTTPKAVFRNLPAKSSVWAWGGKQSSVQYIQDPSENDVEEPDWRPFFTSSAESSLTNVFAINAYTAYLINASAAATLTITGTPSIRHRGWIPDSFNLTGFSLSASPPTFASFFAPSKSHQGQAIYRLNRTSGSWEIVNNPAATVMRSGEAFWVYCQSGSDYQGPMTVDADGSDLLYFGAAVTTLTLKVGNESDVDRTVSLAQQGGEANPVAIGYRSYDAVNNRFVTNPLAAMSPFIVKAGSSTVLTLVARRGSFSGEAASVLTLSDTLGSLVRVPVAAVSKRLAAFPGLWSGVASLEKVSQLSDSSGDPKPAPSALNLNLILHQDKTGQVRLLKQVVLMAKEPVSNSSGVQIINGRNVVLSDDRLIPNYSGVALRDGSKVGRRLSAAGFDYSPSIDPDFGTDFNNTAVKCKGVISGSVTCKIVVESSAAYTQPTNPFLHRYHPDHDNLAADFRTYSEEVNSIERTITLNFDNSNPENPSPDWGVYELTGFYTEDITGLARNAVKVKGTFTLKLASDVDTLND